MEELIETIKILADDEKRNALAKKMNEILLSFVKQMDELGEEFHIPTVILLKTSAKQIEKALSNNE